MERAIAKLRQRARRRSTRFQSAAAFLVWLRRGRIAQDARDLSGYPPEFGNSRWIALSIRPRTSRGDVCNVQFLGCGVSCVGWRFARRGSPTIRPVAEI